MFFWGGKKMKGAESIENEKLSIFAQYTLGQYLTGDKVEIEVCVIFLSQTYPESYPLKRRGENPSPKQATRGPSRSRWLP
jgi:hypothetical protein